MWLARIEQVTDAWMTLVGPGAMLRLAVLGAVVATLGTATPSAAPKPLRAEAAETHAASKPRPAGDAWRQTLKEGRPLAERP